MMKRINTVLDRVDALSLRERIFLFISVFVCVLAVVDYLWLTPALTGYKQLTQRFAAQNTELSRLRDELRVVAAPSQASQNTHTEVEQLNNRMASVNQSIATALPPSQHGVALEPVLAQLLHQQPGLTLVGISTIEDSAAGANGAASASTLPVGMSRRGLELRVAGPYPELVRYVKSLETNLPGLRWGALQVKSDQSPPELRVQLFILEVQP